jgi:hypothetical protein
MGIKFSFSSMGIIHLGAAAILFAIAYKIYTGDFTPDLVTASAVPILAAVHGKNVISANVTKSTED